MKSWAAAPATVIRHPGWSSQHNWVTFDFLTPAPASPPPPGRRSEGDGGLSSWCCACGSSGTCLQRERENMLRHHQEAVTEEHTGTWSLKAGMCLCAESGHAIVSGTFPKLHSGILEVSVGIVTSDFPALTVALTVELWVPTWRDAGLDLGLTWPLH